MTNAKNLKPTITKTLNKLQAGLCRELRLVMQFDMHKKPKIKHLEKCYGKLPPAPDGKMWKVMDALEKRKVGQTTVSLASCGGYWHWGSAGSSVNIEDEYCVTKPYLKAVNITGKRKMKNEIKELRKTISDLKAMGYSA